MSKEDSNDIVILNKYNFLDWKFGLENLCERKLAVTEKAKFAWMVKTLNSSDIQLIMRYESERLTAVGDDGKESVIEGRSKPYTWAMEVLKRVFLCSSYYI
jgi:hypothetical protein